MRAKLASGQTEYRWCSVALAPAELRAHVTGTDDVLVKVQPLLDRFGDSFLASGLSEEETAQLRSHERTGRPLGPPAFVDRLERALRRVPKPQKRGPKPGAQRPGARRTSKGSN